MNTQPASSGHANFPSVRPVVRPVVVVRPLSVRPVVRPLSQRGHFCLNFVSGTTFLSQLCLNFVSARTFLSQLCLSEDICVSTLSQLCLNFVSALSQLCLNFVSKWVSTGSGGGFGPSQQVLVFLYFFFILYYKIIQKFTKCMQWGLNTGCVYLSYASTLKRWDPLATYVLATPDFGFPYPSSATNSGSHGCAWICCVFGCLCGCVFSSDVRTKFIPYTSNFVHIQTPDRSLSWGSYSYPYVYLYILIIPQLYRISIYLIIVISDFIHCT
jgi:hypothetical protein